MDKEDIKHSPIIINKLKNEKFREKSKNFQKAVKKFKNNENYEFNHPLIERHFFLKALQEVNEVLTKNNEGFLIDFSRKFHLIFDHQLPHYLEMNGYYSNDGVSNEDLVYKTFYYLDQVIKKIQMMKTLYHGLKI